MGYMRHHAIIVTAFDRARIEAAHVEAHTRFSRPVDVAYPFIAAISPILGSAVNEYYSFFIAPDGSKEGWGHSDAGDDARRAFKDWLNDQRHSDRSSPYSWVEVQYGDEDWETRIVDDDDAILRDVGLKLD